MPYREEEYFKPYQSMYVDMKLPERAESERARYDKNEAEYDILNRAIGSLDLMTGDVYNKNRIKNEVESRLSGSTRFEHMGRAVKDSITMFQSDTKLLQALKSKEILDKENASREEMRLKGIQVYDFHKTPARDPSGKLIIDPTNGKPLMQDSRETHVTERDGVYKGATEEKLQPEVKAAFLMKGIAEDAITLSKVAQHAGISNDEAKAFLMYGSDIGETKINRIVEAFLPEFENSIEGGQLKKALMQLQVNPFTKDTYSEAEATAELKKFLVAEGLKQQTSKFQYIQKPVPATVDAKEEKPVTPNQIASYTPTRVNPNKVGTLNFSKKPDGTVSKDNNTSKYFKNGKIVTETIVNKTGSMSVSGIPKNTSERVSNDSAYKRFKNEVDQKGYYNVKGNDYGRMLYMLEEFKGIKGNDSDEVFAEKMHLALHNNEVEMTKIYAATPKGAASGMVAIGHSLGMRKIYDPRTGATTTFDQWADKNTGNTWNPFANATVAADLKDALMSGGTATKNSSRAEFLGTSFDSPFDGGGLEIVFYQEGVIGQGEKPIRLVIEPENEFRNLGETVTSLNRLYSHPEQKKIVKTPINEYDIFVDSRMAAVDRREFRSNYITVPNDVDDLSKGTYVKLVLEERYVYRKDLGGHASGWSGVSDGYVPNYTKQVMDYYAQAGYPMSAAYLTTAPIRGTTLNVGSE